MNEYKLFTQRIGLIGITHLLLSLSGIILLPILTKTLPIEEYGIWIQSTVIIGLILAVATLGLPSTMVRFLAAAKKKEEIQEGFYSIVFIVLFASVIASSLLFLFSEPIAVTLFNDNLTIARILALIVFIECLNFILLQYFRAFQQIKKHSIFSFLQTYLRIVLVAYFVLSGYGILGAVIGLLISDLILFLSQGFLIVSEIGITIPKFIHTREHLAFGLPLVPAILSHWVVNSSDVFIISIFLGSAFVGYYSPAYFVNDIIHARNCIAWISDNTFCCIEFFVVRSFCCYCSDTRFGEENKNCRCNMGYGSNIKSGVEPDFYSIYGHFRRSDYNADCIHICSYPHNALLV
jgi:O-antigen/teichoic acid export membrane protein